MNVRSCLINYEWEKVSGEFTKYLQKLSSSKATMWYFEGYNDDDSQRCALFVFEYPVNVDVEKFENVEFVDTISSLNELFYQLESNSFDHYVDMQSTFRLDLKK